MPRTDFHRPNPLDSDVIMDATARLLAPRKSAAVKPAASSAKPEKKSDAPRKRRRKTSEVQAETSVKSPGKQPASPQVRKRVEKAEAKPASPPSQQKKKRSSGKSRRDRQRGPVDPVKSGKPKDSTEQESLMKPYYLDIGQ